ncbi:Hypothetical protein GbCGDNIH1_1402 [Granulibacter bethesdensis CGDNIH1]|uniref:Uncharacterized protein n=1 Tax=Granulibacter bethesdensis (strain ATCC BAA-1260 / CGDNIH1) TaxID=391165 RepID=Q0BSA3_GRABC|nr:Hypothetical protein GbCGDNIH1_1402 [Granulibacter bethesdensis CGDNIH1]APH52126.1 Hypothetical protein GbCGDNIH5_1402 [Granulibacter bethesdensis]APH64817.1 Hypothetical protein GbCGDNIH1I4_1402 [Granulibacter bethesdensis]
MGRLPLEAENGIFPLTHQTADGRAVSRSFFHNVSRIKGRPISQWLFFCSIC